MLRRVARVARVLLLMLGMGFMACIPANWLWQVQVVTAWPPERCLVFCEDGVVQITWLMEVGPNIPLDPPGFNKVEHDLLQLPSRPYFKRSMYPDWKTATLNLPLWLLTAVCLAWPVTSFLVRRRRRGRGFEVEAKDGGAVSTADS